MRKIDLDRPLKFLLYVGIPLKIGYAIYTSLWLSGIAPSSYIENSWMHAGGYTLLAIVVLLAIRGVKITDYLSFLLLGGMIGSLLETWGLGWGIPLAWIIPMVLGFLMYIGKLTVRFWGPLLIGYWVVSVIYSQFQALDWHMGLGHFSLEYAGKMPVLTISIILLLWWLQGGKLLASPKNQTTPKRSRGFLSTDVLEKERSRLRAKAKAKAEAKETKKESGQELENEPNREPSQEPPNESNKNSDQELRSEQNQKPEEQQKTRRRRNKTNKTVGL